MYTFFIWLRQKNAESLSVITMIHRSCTTTTTTARRYNGYDETLDKTLSYLNTTLPTLCDVVCTLLIILLSFVYITVEYVICLLRCYNTLKI